MALAVLVAVGIVAVVLVVVAVGKPNLITDDMVKHSSNEDVLSELANMHKTIDDNDYQSTTVEKSYKITMDTLHRKIFKKLVKSKDEDIDKSLVTFAKIVT